MKKTYVTSMPDHIGAFLKASKCFSALGINITRVSYNKAVDSHTLFIDAEGTPEQLKTADAELLKIGYLQNEKRESGIVLIEFCLRDEPGSVTSILELINSFSFNISYISSQENGSDYQFFKMGLYVENPDDVTRFISEAEKLCRVRIIDYNSSEKVYDNSIFYNSYVSALYKMMGLSESVREQLTVHVNLAMQTLDEQGLSPYRTFDSISRFAELLSKSKGESYQPRVSHRDITENTKIYTIEPQCGSNIIIIESLGEYLFIDSGYACYKDEALSEIKKIVPDFDKISKKVILTHADLDHCGLANCFDEVITSHRSALCLSNEEKGENGYREENPLHRPYINICKILTSYSPMDTSRLVTPWDYKEELKYPLTQIGFYDFGELHFEVYEGKGGHLPGEIILIDYRHRIAFTGDVYVNIHGMTAPQAEYNKYAPILMTGVDTEPKLCKAEREEIMMRLGAGEWLIFGAHGCAKEYKVN
ncbi:MAG: MBL fold metallo-hydrolase [Clostridia bacterium]|nr:MBL fold metallo-hydrolase [Clostridia bacterium]